MIKKTITQIFLLTAALFMSIVSADDRTVLVQSTTSTANSGLYDYLLPHFESETGINVNVVAVGTGQAIKNASNCDADVLLVHAKEAELNFVSQGYGVERHDLMYNDFVVVGPQEDPASIEGLNNVKKALKAIADSKSIFVSRGDNSGTHKKEINLWKNSGTNPAQYSGKWYRETGSGMGATLNIAVGMGAYTITDRATWINFNNRAKHKILIEGDDSLFNQYGIILVNSQKCPDSNTESGKAFVKWMISENGQSLIAEYRVNEQQLFHPNAIKP